jgi:hypothetical protein
MGSKVYAPLSPNFPFRATPLTTGSRASVPSSWFVRFKFDWSASVAESNAAYQSNVDIWVVGYSSNGKILPGYSVDRTTKESSNGSLVLDSSRREVIANLMKLTESPKLSGVALLLSLHDADDLGLDFKEVRGSCVRVVAPNARPLLSYQAPRNAHGPRLPLGKLERTSDGGWEFTGGQIPDLKFAKKS